LQPSSWVWPGHGFGPTSGVVSPVVNASLMSSAVGAPESLIGVQSLDSSYRPLPATVISPFTVRAAPAFLAVLEQVPVPLMPVAFGPTHFGQTSEKVDRR